MSTEFNPISDHPDKPRCFYLRRTEDVSGVSGTGYVAEGCQFTDGTCVIRWKSEMPTTTVLQSLSNVKSIHGHPDPSGANRTEVIWIGESH